MKIKKDIAVRCENSVPMTLDRPLQQLLEDQVENKKQIREKLLEYSSKDRLEYVKLGYDDTFVQKLRTNYENALSNVLIK